MARFVQVVKDKDGGVLVAQACWCASPLCRLAGLQFRRSLAPGEGLLLVYPGNTLAGSAIHMFFVFFPLGVVWVNDSGEVVGKALAKPWRPYYAPPAPARFVLEAEPQVLERVEIGERVHFAEAVE